MAAFICSMNMNAQYINVYKDGKLVKSYATTEADYVEFAEEAPAPEHEYVDLGLTSKTLWATCNIGAEKPEDAGLFFAWGETTGHSGEVTKETTTCSDGYSYDWESAPFNNGQKSYSADYFSSTGRAEATGSASGTELVAKYDAATVNWGSEWQMPNIDQLIELEKECTWTWDDTNKGYKVSNKSDDTKFIFLPAAGDRYNNLHSDIGVIGNYWSRTIYGSSDKYGLYLGFRNDAVYTYETYRSYGFSVRAVRAQE